MKGNPMKQKRCLFRKKHFYRLVTLVLVILMGLWPVSCSKTEVSQEATSGKTEAPEEVSSNEEEVIEEAASDYIFYLQNNEIRYIDLEKTDSVQPEQLTEQYLKTEGEDVYAVSSNIDRIFKNQAVIFADHSDPGEMRLYYKSLNKEDEKPRFIDENISEYLTSADKEHMLYVKGDERGLYRWDFDLKKSEKLSEYVGEYYISGDGKNICFLDENSDLYVKSQNEKPKKIAKNIHYIVYCNEELTKFVYSRGENLYLYHAGKEEKIANNAIVIGFLNNGEGYYRTDEKMIPWDELIEDDVAPDSPRKEFIKNLSEEDADEYGWTVNTLWYFDGEKSHKLNERCLWISSGIMWDIALFGWVMQDRTQVFFREYDAKAFTKIKLSELNEEYDLYEIMDKVFEEFQKTTPYFVAIKDRVMTMSGVVAETVSADSSGRRLYFYKNVDDQYLKGDLYRVEVSEDGVSDPIVVSDNVSTTRKNVFGDGTEIYFKFKAEFVGDLYVDGKKVDEDVNTERWDYDEKTKTLLYFTTWNRGIEHGHLKSYTKGESKFIAKDVYDAYFTDGGRVLYLTNTEVHREANNKLYVYDGEKTQQIAENVQRLFFTKDKGRDPM